MHQGFKSNHNLNAAQLINPAFQVLGYVPEKVKYRLKELKARYRIAKRLAGVSGWGYEPVSLTINADNTDDERVGGGYRSKPRKRPISWSEAVVVPHF